MIISDLSHLEFISEAPSISGGLGFQSVCHFGITTGTEVRNRSFVVKLDNSQLIQEIENTSGRKFIQTFNGSGPSKNVTAVTWAANGGQAFAWVAAK